MTPWTAACQVSLSFTVSWSLLKLMSIESMVPSNHLILCCLLLLLPSIFPSLRVFSTKMALCIRWPKYWSFSFSIIKHPLNFAQASHMLWSPTAWILIPVLLLTYYVTLGKLSTFSGFLFPHLWSGTNNSTYASQGCYENHMS